MIKLIKYPSNFASLTKVTQRAIGSLNGDLVPEFKIPEEGVKMPITPERYTESSLALAAPKGQLFARPGAIGGNFSFLFFFLNRLYNKLNPT